VVRDSIVMHDSHVAAHAVLDHAILDRDVQVGAGTRIGEGDASTPNAACPEHLASGLTIVGKGARVPGGLTVGRNVRIGPKVVEKDFTADVPGGGVVHGSSTEH